ncbi:zinc finger protein 532 [Elysia marginata]|uniref:Zinc finger protein 532 n=1 Tax=Elysia marginata TaxID=1093978 RepID=A0AAV4G3D1_9GAST|nr:zinc finger protein 532 [Elysia marginata]
MAEEYLNPSNGEQQSCFGDQVLSHSANVVAVPNSYYISSSQALTSSGSSLDYIDNPTYEHHSYQETVNIPSSSYVTLPENAGQQAIYSVGDTGQQFFQGDVSQGTTRGANVESVDALTRSAFELLQGVVAQASNNNYNGTSNNTPVDRNQLVSLLPASSSTGTTIVIDAQKNMTKTNGLGTSSLSAARPGVGLTSNQKIIKVVSQRSLTGNTATAKPSNDQPANYRCVLIKKHDGTQKNCIVLNPGTASNLNGSTTQGPKSSAPSSRATAVMKLANSVEQEILDMIRKTSDSFTIKGEDARKSGLLEKTTDKPLTNSDGTAKFFCVICMEKYTEKEGFQYHLERISFVLKYKCIKCATVFTFFNKCALWIHLNGHFETIDYQRVLCLYPYDFASNPNVFRANMKSSVASDSKEIMTRVLSNTQGIVKCPICGEFVRNLPIHLKRPDGKYHAHVCHICKMFLPNKCSLQAHAKWHKGHQAQLCCPECGFTRQGLSLKDMFDHVDACMHFNRAEAFSCECKASFPSLVEAKKHFLDTHMKRLSKCPACSVVFTDPKLLDSHLERNPQCQSRARHLFTQVTCLCTLCKSVLTTAIEAKLHIQKHISNEPQLAWVCFLCSMMFSTANELRIHCEEDHPHRAKRCTICFMLFCNRQLLVDHIINKRCNPGYHSLASCADMPQKPAIVIDDLVKNLYKIPVALKSPNIILSSAASQRPQEKSFPTPSSNTAVLPKEKQGHSVSSQQCELSHRQDESSQDADEEEIDDTTQGAHKKSKVAIRRPSSLNKTQSALLDELQQWQSKNGREIVPTTAPPSKKRGKPKKEKRPPYNLVCGVSAKGISYQCHPCKIIVTGTNNFLTHMKYHEQKGDCSYGAFTHCSVCDKLVGSHMIMKHLKHHQDKGVIVCCRCQRRDFSDLEDAIQHAHNLCGYRKIGDDAAQVPGQSENVNAVTISNVYSLSRPQQTQHTKEDQPSTEPVLVPDEEPTKNAAAAQAKNKLYFCHLCGLVFENVILRDQHVRKSHGGTRKTYHCLLCEKKKVVKTFVNQLTARKHVTTKHRVVQPNLVDKCLKELPSQPLFTYSLSFLVFLGSAADRIQ